MAKPALLGEEFAGVTGFFTADSGRGGEACLLRQMAGRDGKTYSETEKMETLRREENRK